MISLSHADRLDQLLASQSCFWSVLVESFNFLEYGGYFLEVSAHINKVGSIGDKVFFFFHLIPCGQHGVISELLQ